MNPQADDPVVVHGHRGTRAVQRMVEYAPSSGGLALWARHADAPGFESAPPIATDGTTLFYGQAFDAAPLPRQTGYVARGVLHIALRHPQRYGQLQQRLGDVDRQLFDTCAQAIVNSALAHLGWLELPPRALLLERLLGSALGLTVNAEAALLEWDVEALYRALDDRPPPRNGGERGDGQRSSRARALAANGGADRILIPTPAGAPETQAALTREWHERVVRAHAGDGEHSMLRALLADLPRSRTPWEQLLRTRLAHALAPRRQLSWSRPTRSYIANQGRAGAHRRLPWEPGPCSSATVPRLVLMVDVSGSIDSALIARFTREIDAITRRLEAGLVLIVGDDRVHRVEHFEPGRAQLQALAFSGGGGTDFTPLLEEADRHRPDIGVFLTDLEGPAGFRPAWPVIWAVPPERAAATPPFGRKLVLE